MQPDPACIELSTHSCQGVCFTVFKRQGHSYADPGYRYPLPGH